MDARFCHHQKIHLLCGWFCKLVVSLQTLSDAHSWCLFQLCFTMSISAYVYFLFLLRGTFITTANRFEKEAFHLTSLLLLSYLLLLPLFPSCAPLSPLGFSSHLMLLNMVWGCEDECILKSALVFLFSSAAKLWALTMPGNRFCHRVQLFSESICKCCFMIHDPPSLCVCVSSSFLSLCGNGSATSYSTAYNWSLSFLIFQVKKKTFNCNIKHIMKSTITFYTCCRLWWACDTFSLCTRSTDRQPSVHEVLIFHDPQESQKRMQRWQLCGVMSRSGWIKFISVRGGSFNFKASH